MNWMTVGAPAPASPSMPTRPPQLVRTSAYANVPEVLPNNNGASRAAMNRYQQNVEQRRQQAIQNRQPQRGGKHSKSVRRRKSLHHRHSHKKRHRRHTRKN